jgi:hypothetical protein
MKMPINNIYRLKDCSVSSVGADHPEFTPLERGKSLDEGGSPQVGGGHPVIGHSLVGGGQEEMGLLAR